MMKNMYLREDQSTAPNTLLKSSERDWTSKQSPFQHNQGQGTQSSLGRWIQTSWAPVTFLSVRAFVSVEQESNHNPALWVCTLKNSNGGQKISFRKLPEMTLFT